MTPTQIIKLSNIELLETYKQKARCFHSERTTMKLFRAISTRGIVSKSDFNDISTELFHLQMGEGDAKFNDVMDKLIKLEKNKIKNETK